MGNQGMFELQMQGKRCGVQGQEKGYGELEARCPCGRGGRAG